MSDRPILFSGPMVRALLDGRKTQTRRVLKPQPSPAWTPPPIERQDIRIVPYRPGDRLWVREAWRCEARYDGMPPRDLKPGIPIYYAADPDPRDSEPGCAGRFRQGMHMPRWASRLTLVVTDVRVQRLQEISEADAVAEGAITPSKMGAHYTALDAPWGKRRVGLSAYDLYRRIWDDLNAERGFGWATNPWVVAVSFTVHRCNIDQMTAAEASTEARASSPALSGAHGVRTEK